MKNKNLKFAFWGTPEVASKTLQILKDSGYLPIVIITSPDRPAGRGLHMTPSPVSLWAENNNITCLKPERLDDKFIKEFDKFNIDFSVIVAYGKILKEEIINKPELGTINIHYSLLPKYRGASPLETCLLKGDKITGISIQQMQFKLDSGPILIKKEIKINIDDTKEEVREKLIKLGAETLVEILPDFINQKINLEIQNEEQASFCKKIKKEEGLLDLNDNPLKNYNKYRAFSGWPGTYFFKNNKRIKIKKAKYENNSFVIERVVPAGKKEINYTDFLRNN